MRHGIIHRTISYIDSLQVAELKQEAGKISNLELQRKVVRVFYYLCVVTLQYTAPMILILYLCFLYKTLGGGSWTGGFTPATFSESGGQAAAAGAELDSEFQEVEVAEQMLAMLNTMDVEITMAVLLDMMAMDSKIWSIKLANNRI